MAKKKNPSKKHKFKHVEQPDAAVSAAVAEPGTSVQASPRAAQTARSSVVSSDGRDFRYVSGDVRRIAFMAVGLVALELVLYYLLVHTSVGPAIYQHINV